MDAKTTLFLTTKGLQEIGNKRSELDFKSRSILTSLKNSEKSLTSLLEKIFIDNKEVVILVERLYKDGFLTADQTLSAKAQAASLAAPSLPNRDVPSATSSPAETVPNEAGAGGISKTTEIDEALKRQNDLVSRVRMEKANADRDALALEVESRRLADVEAQRVAAIAEAKRAADEARAVAEALRKREMELAASEHARLLAEAELQKTQARESERLELARAEAERLRAELEIQKQLEERRIAAIRLEADRLEAEKREDRLRMEAQEKSRRDAAEREATRLEALRLEAEAEVSARLDSEREEADRRAAEARRSAAIAAESARQIELAKIKESARLESERQAAAAKQTSADRAAVQLVELQLEPLTAEDVAGPAHSVESEKARRQQEVAEYLLEREKRVLGEGSSAITRDSGSSLLAAPTPAPVTTSAVEPNPSASETGQLTVESLVPALTDTDSIDILPSEEGAPANSPSLGKTLRPSLTRFLPGMLRSKPTDVAAAPNTPVAVMAHSAISSTETSSRTVQESVSAPGSVKPRIELTPVLSKVRRENASKHIPSLIRPAIDPAKKDESPAGLLGKPGGAGGDFLSSFGRETITSVPATKSTGTIFGRGKAELDLKPVSLSHTKALALVPKVVVSEGVFLLSDFCIDNLSSTAADFIEKLERCRDRQSLQDVVKEIYGQFGLQEKTKIAALLKTIEDINATA